MYVKKFSQLFYLICFISDNSIFPVFKDKTNKKKNSPDYSILHVFKD